MNISTFFDSYSIQARLLPAAVLIFPWAILALGVSVDFSKFQLIALPASLALSMLISQHVRDSGKSFEHALLKKWGAYPTTLDLMYSSSKISPTELQSYRDKIQTLFPDIKLLDSEEEQENPKNAIEKLNAIIAQVREATRDVQKYNILFKENISYGFRRNLASLKVIGITSCTICSCIALSLLIFPTVIPFTLSPTILYLSFLVNLIFIYLWIFIWDANWVRHAAYRYSSQLLRSLHSL